MTQFLPRAVSSVFPRATSADDSAAVFYSRETSGPALRGNEPLTRSHMRGPDGAEPPAQFNSFSQRYQFAQAVIDVLAIAFWIVLTCALAVGVAFALFVLLFVKFP